MGILVECNKILDACDVASRNRGNDFFTISFPGEEWFLFCFLIDYGFLFSYWIIGKILSAVTLEQFYSPLQWSERRGEARFPVYECVCHAHVLLTHCAE